MTEPQTTRIEYADEIERLRFGLKMCLGHAGQPDAEGACQAVIHQTKATLTQSYERFTGDVSASERKSA